MPKPDYGLDAPGVVHKLTLYGGASVAAAVLLRWMNGPNGLTPALAGAGISMLLTAALMVYGSRVAKMKKRDEILDRIPWRGDERVLDAGCGRGLFLVGAAKRAAQGTVTGVDLWRERDQSGNDPEATRSNARLEGVEGRIRLETGDLRELPFPDGRFDVVLSSLAIHNIAAKSDRARAVTELARVLKPGGSLAIFDIIRTGEYAATLRGKGLEIKELSPWRIIWLLPARWLLATKPVQT